VRVAPDRAIVWNERQQEELVKYHGLPVERVVITGAPRFDEFFAMQPSTGRAAFLADLALPADKPLLLYLCSSNFVAPEEVQFVRTWIDQVRRSHDELVRDAVILVRPHPANAEQWEQADLSLLGGVAVWNHRSTMNADQGLYDSLHHADAIVGLNTSAMIEAGIVGKPVFTVTVPEFAGGQQQTLHFHYLLARNGGLVEVASSFTEHLEQLSEELRHPGGRREQSLRFVRNFVRPHGLDRPAAPRMIEAIEALQKIRKRRRGRAAWLSPVRWALLTALQRRAAPAKRQ
jgi:hypothetical protein